MSNLAERPEDFFERLPTRISRGVLKHEHDRWHYDTSFPWRHFYGFLKSKVGKHVDKVIAEFTKAAWVPRQFRTYTKFAETVEMNTFFEAGKVFFYDCYDMKPRSVVEYGDVYYVNPKNKVLCYAKRRSYDFSSKYANERAKWIRILDDYHQLLKLDGVWYEVKGETYPVNSPSYRWTSPDQPMLENGRRKLFTGIKILLKKQLDSNELHANRLQNDTYPAVKPPCRICGAKKCKHNFPVLW